MEEKLTIQRNIKFSDTVDKKITEVCMFHGKSFSDLVRNFFIAEHEKIEKGGQGGKVKV